MIRIDSRGAGEGKTTTNIYPMIRKLLLNQQRILLVVPSINLQNEYEKQFYNTIGYVSVNSQTTTNVSERIHFLMRDREVRCLCITHQAWILLELSPKQKEEWHLILDEVINPTRTCVFERKKSMIDWSSVLQMPETIIPDIFYQIETVMPDDSISRDSSLLRDLTNPNWKTYCRSSSFQSLRSNTKQRSEFIQEMKIDIIEGYLSVLIAAAAFEQTFMAFWLKANKVKTEVIHKFERKPLPVVIHGTDELKWSNTLRKNNGQIIQKYNQYVREVIQENNHLLLSVRNNGSKNAIPGEQVINHNAHGLNQFTDYTAVNCESALILSNEFQYWLSERFDMAPGEITCSHSSYLFYQIIMRCCLRIKGNERKADIFLLDHQTAVGLGEFIEFQDIKVIDIKHTRTRKKKPNAMSNAERCRKYREKQKLEALDLF